MTLLTAYGMDPYDTYTEFVREPNVHNMNDDSSLSHIIMESTTGRFGGGAMNLTPGSIRFAVVEFQIPDRKTVWVTFAFKHTSWVLTSEVFWMGYNGAEHIQFLVNRDRRQLQIQILGATVGYIDFQHNVWNHMEVKLIVDDVVGELTIRLNGVQVFSSTGIDTQSGGTAFVNQIQFRQGIPLGTQPNTRVDDLIINDDNGSVNNTWMGDIEIQRLIPNADTATADFTPLAGTNFSNIDDSPGPDDDTSYVESSTAAHQDLYDIPSLKTQSTTVAAFIVRAYIRKTDAGARSIRMLSFEGVTLGTGAIKSMSSTYSYVNEIFELNPDTSAAWTILEINGAQIGMENV